MVSSAFLVPGRGSDEKGKASPRKLADRRGVNRMNDPKLLEKNGKVTVENLKGGSHEQDIHEQGEGSGLEEEGKRTRQRNQ